VVHSHTHTEPYPSATDVRDAPDPGWADLRGATRHRVTWRTTAGGRSTPAGTDSAQPR
jgi:proteasome lid subunit RPN8/RPN11